MDHNKTLNLIIRLLRQFYVPVMFIAALVIVFFNITSDCDVNSDAINLSVLLKSANTWGILSLGPVLAALASLNQDMETGLIFTKLSVSLNKSTYIRKKITSIYLWTTGYTLAANLLVILWAKNVFHWMISGNGITVFLLMLIAFITTETFMVSLIIYINFFIKTSLYGLISVVLIYGILEILIVWLTKVHMTKVFTFIIFPFLFSAMDHVTILNLMIQIILSVILTAAFYLLILWTFEKKDWNFVK